MSRGGQNIKITDEQLREVINAGLTRQEIAILFNMHVESVARRMTQIGVHAKHALSASARPQAITNTWHCTPGAENFINQKCGDEFEFVAYMRRRYKVRCKKCGAILERAQSTIIQKHIRCDECKARELEQRQIQQERIKLIRSFYAIKELKTPKTCEKCGEIFYSQYPQKKYCSDKCKKRKHAQDYRKEHKREHKYRERCRKYGVYYDASVTRDKVIARDHGVCQICGVKCDETDKGWGSFGERYPTVDHIIPLSKGGTHTWDNVQCACAICNSYKRDIV